MPEHLEVRRKSTKRVATILSDDEEDEGESRLSSPPSKRQRFEDSYVVDDNAYDDSADFEAEDSDSGLPMPTSATKRHSPPRHRKPSSKVLAGGSSLKVSISKSQKAILSDAESDDYSFDADAMVEDLDILNDDDDEDFVEERKRPLKTRVGTKGKQSKGLKGSRGKGKAEAPEKQILVKDERQVVPNQLASTSKRQRSKPTLNLDTNTVVDDATVASSVEISDPAKDIPDSAAPSVKEASPPPKRKLPPIKKNKVPGPGTTAPAASKPPVLAGSTAKLINSESDSLTPATPVARVPAAFQGAADFDLRDPSVYDGLFKNAGGSTPRSGLNRREKEEQRRKELNKMRDDAKAKRAVDAKHTFDLQAQMDKICRFEERLRRANSAVLFPNILGGKMKEIWEQERRRHSTTHRPFRGSQEAPEEGEM